MSMLTGLSHDERHEFWRVQLLDDLYRRLEAIDADPSLDPKGRRRAALHDLVSRFEQIELEELRRNHSSD